MYKTKDKFGGIRNNFIFKLSIFHDKCQLVDLFLDVYLENISVILINQAQTHFYANCNSIILFKELAKR